MKNLVKTMRKPNWNFALNAVMTLCMLAIIGIGFLIKHTLLQGQERKTIYGQNIELYLLNMNRHQWGNIHFILGLVFWGLLTLHIFLHWKVITVIYHKIIKAQLAKRILAFGFIIICSILILIPFFITPKIEPIKKGKGRQVTLVTDFNSNLPYLCNVN
ncbi:DUF4405 domain-containing protein [Algibacter sp. L4_22]|uniref:DUF4405 domain-containing protein n=1 Tax=Algibacter sp. L4_22 TaxID=2942477 RepID=UPI00201B556F|nr:DUF4405 domain-containing protein [Algibacter sp. L4_22]MCL5128307.1 DUF4405 domain-containing protein [Algibacter sp. L4_22]